MLCTKKPQSVDCKMAAINEQSLIACDLCTSVQQTDPEMRY